MTGLCPLRYFLNLLLCYRNTDFGSYIQSDRSCPDEFMGVSLTHHMDFNWLVDRTAGLAGLAAHYRVAESKNHASFRMDIRAWLRFNFSPVYSIRTQRFAAG